MFNIEGNNIIVNYNTIIILFKFLISDLAIKLFKINLKTLDSNINKHFYSSILYYYNNLKCLVKYNNKKRKRELSVNIFWDNIRTNFLKSRYYFPLMKNEKQTYFFFLNDYIKDLMIYDKVDYTPLYSFLVNFIPKNNNYNAYLLIFLLKEKWNIDFEFKPNYSFKQKSSSYYEKFKQCLNYIKYGITNIFISLLLLKITLPIIIKLIIFYFDNFEREDKDFINIENIDKNNEIQIFTHKNEKIWNNIRKIDILNYLKDANEKKQIIFEIIHTYFSALNKTMKRFSEFGKNFRNNGKENDFWDSKKVKVLNYMGRGFYKRKNEEKIRKKRISKRYKNLFISKKQYRIPPP